MVGACVFDQPGNRTGSAGSSAPSVDAGGRKAWRRAAEHRTGKRRRRGVVVNRQADCFWRRRAWAREEGEGVQEPECSVPVPGRCLVGV